MPASSAINRIVSSGANSLLSLSIFLCHTSLLHDVSNKGSINQNMDSHLHIIIPFCRHFRQQFCHLYIFASDCRGYNRHECEVRFPSTHSFVLCCPLQETLPLYSNSQETLFSFFLLYFCLPYPVLLLLF